MQIDNVVVLVKLVDLTSRSLKESYASQMVFKDKGLMCWTMLQEPNSDLCGVHGIIFINLIPVVLGRMFFLYKRIVDKLAFLGWYNQFNFMAVSWGIGLLWKSSQDETKEPVMWLDSSCEKLCMRRYKGENK